jgi:hypothetical protein
LATSLNTELVVTILKGITILAASSSDNTDHMKESDMLNVKQTSNIEINSLKILNAKKWEKGIQGINTPGEGQDLDVVEEIVLGAIEDSSPAVYGTDSWFGVRGSTLS